MSQALIDRIRKQRQFRKVVGGFTFICRRPTDQEAGEIDRGATFCDIAQRFVVGWDGVTENDVAGGGGSDVLEFDALLWREWCADRKDFWSPLAQAVLDAYTEHAKDMDLAAKNLQPGSSNAT